MKALCLVIDFKFSAVLLSSRESLILTTIRQDSRSSVSVFPLWLCSGGFPWFTIGIVSLHLHRVTISDEFSSKFRNEFHSQIWDPGISSGGSEDRNMKFRSTPIDNPLSLFYLTISRAFSISILVSAFQNQRTNVNGIRSRQWVIKSPSTLWNRFSRCNVTPLFWCIIEWAINADDDCNRIILKKHQRLQNNNGLGLRDDFLSLRTQCYGGDVFTVFRSDYFGSMDTEFMVTNEHQWIGRYRRHDSESFQATYQSFCLIKVMRKAFRSFIYKMIACYKCMKRGLNRFILLPVRLLLESRVTSTSSSKLGFNFLNLFQRLYLNGFLYHVSCKLFMK